MITDRIDGDLARSRGLVTNFGKVVDPIADKALVTMALVGLSIIGEVWWWVTVVVLVREWGITAVRFWVIRHGVMAAGRGGQGQDPPADLRHRVLPHAAVDPAVARAVGVGRRRSAWGRRSSSPW